MPTLNRVNDLIAWRKGSGAPSDTLGSDGEWYLNEDNGDKYFKVTGSWVFKGGSGSSGVLPAMFSAAVSLSTQSNDSSLTPLTWDSMLFDDGSMVDVTVPTTTPITIPAGCDRAIVSAEVWSDSGGGFGMQLLLGGAVPLAYDYFRGLTNSLQRHTLTSGACEVVAGQTISVTFDGTITVNVTSGKLRVVCWDSTAASVNSGHVIEDNTSPMIARSALNFVGFDLTDDLANDATVVTMPVVSASGHTISDDLIDQTTRTNLDFKGAGFIVQDDPANDATVISLVENEGITVPVDVPYSTEKVPFTPTTSAAWDNTTWTGQKWRQGNMLYMEISGTVTAPPSLGASARLDMVLPDGLSVDNSIIAATAYDNVTFGSGSIVDTSASAEYQAVLSASATTLRIHTVTVGEFTTIQDTVPFTWANGDTIKIRAAVPIDGWDSTQSVVFGAIPAMYSARMTGPAQAMAGGSSEKLIFNATTFDDKSIVDTVNSQFIIPAGCDRATVSFEVSQGTATLEKLFYLTVKKNDIQIASDKNGQTMDYGVYTLSTGVFSVVEGDIITFETYWNDATDTTGQHASIVCWNSKASSGGVGGAGHAIEDNAIEMTPRAALNFVGFDVVDDEATDATIVTVPSISAMLANEEGVSFAAWDSNGGGASQSINRLGVLPIDAVHSDTHGGFNTSTYEYTVPVTGTYIFGWFTYTDSPTQAGRRVYLKKNANTQLGVTGSNGNGQNITVMTECIKGDTIYVDSSTYGIDYWIGPKHNEFWGALVSVVNNYNVEGKVPVLFSARVSTNTPQTIPTAAGLWTPFEYTDVEFDDNSMADLVSNNTRLTVPAGCDRVTIEAFAHLNNSDTVCHWRIIKNGTLEICSEKSNTTTSRQSLSSGVLEVTSGDYFEYALNLNVQADTYKASLSMSAWNSQAAEPSTPFQGALVSLGSLFPMSATTYTSVEFDTEAYDTSSFYSLAAPERFTVPAGVSKVKVSAQLQWSPTPSSSHLLVIYKNGNASYPGFAHDRKATFDSDYYMSATTAVIDVIEGDYFEVKAYSANGTDIDPGAGTWFAIEAIETISNITMASSLPGPESFLLACSDESAPLETGVGVASFRLPYNFQIQEVLADVNSAPTGAEIIVDINVNGASILSTKLTIDAGEVDSFTAATAYVLSSTDFSKRDSITIDIDQVGSTSEGAGLMVTIVGVQL